MEIKTKKKLQKLNKYRDREKVRKQTEGKGKQQLLNWIQNAPSNDKYQNNTSDSISY